MHQLPAQGAALNRLDPQDGAGLSMPRSSSEKIDEAVELWKNNPQLKLREFITLYRQKHGDTLSLHSAFTAKKFAGLTRSTKTANGFEPTARQLMQVQVLAKAMGGMKKVRAHLKELYALAHAAGGFDQLDRCLEIIDKLMM
jgi:hypothetical protein